MSCTDKRILNRRTPKQSRQHGSLVLAYRDTVSIVGTGEVSKCNCRGAPYSRGPEQPLVSRRAPRRYLTPGELSIKLHNLVFRHHVCDSFPPRGYRCTTAHFTGAFMFHGLQIPFEPQTLPLFSLHN